MNKIINVLTPPLGLFIGYSGENEFRTFEFDVREWKKQYLNGKVSISFKRPDMKTAYPVVTNSDEDFVIWKIKSTDVDVYGEGEITIRIVEDEIIGKLCSIPTYCKSSIDFTNEIPIPFPDWLKNLLEAASKTSENITTNQQIEQSITTIETSITNDKNEVNEAKISVEEFKQIAITKAAEALASAIAAAGSESTSKQVMTDLLAMMGVDLATLTGGKVPLSQLPATATLEIYEISSPDELISLVAQRGDRAELITTVDGERTTVKAWQLLGNDATVRDNWVVCGTSYAVQAGNATTATNAFNADAVNGHRMVRFASIAELDAAVKVSGTIYYAPYNQE